MAFRSGSLAAVAAVAALVLSGCASSSSGRPPRPAMPIDDDPCAAYCLVWVPPVYRDVPRVQPCPSKIKCEKVLKEKIDFVEVRKPGKYTAKCVPDQCRHENFVQVTPGRDDWKKVACPCTCGDCYRKVHVPPKYKLCERCETDQGFTYCSFCPPEYDVVAKKRMVCEVKSVPYPPKFNVSYRKDLYAPGHWEWQKHYDCTFPKSCSPKKLCVSPCTEPDPCTPPPAPSPPRTSRR